MTRISSRVVSIAVLAALLAQQDGKSSAEEVKSTGFKGAYFVNGEIYVNTFGTPEGKPLTTGHQDFKPSWSKTGNMLVCFYQTGFKYKDTGRTLYVADFDATRRTITNAKAFANEEANPSPWFAYPRWTKDETAIVYHASRKLYLYTLKGCSTVKVSTNDQADYRYPHCEATPK